MMKYFLFFLLFGCISCHKQTSSSRSLLDYTYQESQTDSHDKKIFFIVFGIGTIIVGFISSYIWKEGLCLDESTTPDYSSSRNTQLHPPPVNVQLHPPSGNIHLVPSISSNFSYNRGIVPLQLNDDRPPDYATVVTSDLAHQGTVFPQVVAKQNETPPPKFPDRVNFM